MDIKKNATHIIAHMQEFYRHAKFNENPESMIGRLENNLLDAYDRQGEEMILKLKEPFNMSFEYPHISANLQINKVINPEGELGLFEKNIRYLFFSSPQSIINNKKIMSQAEAEAGDRLIALASVEKHHQSGYFFVNDRLFVSPNMYGEIEKFNKKGQLLIKNKPLTPLLPYVVNEF
ncbi:MAG: hypothetical protein PF569_06625 [Candidatus Woesearchaeota archaeon]|jgi:hypothetical protein|nr:hypothetical protein [Candidatus Woesearchaeota archaeon]